MLDMVGVMLDAEEDEVLTGTEDELTRDAGNKTDGWVLGTAIDAGAASDGNGRLRCEESDEDGTEGKGSTEDEAGKEDDAVSEDDAAAVTLGADAADGNELDFGTGRELGTGRFFVDLLGTTCCAMGSLGAALEEKLRASGFGAMVLKASRSLG
jgi:hypothetical protein